MKWDAFRSPSSGPGQLIHLGQVVALNQSEAYVLASVIWRIPAGEKLEVCPAPEPTHHSAWLNAIKAEVLKKGPRRVLVTSQGKTVSPERAAALGVPTDLIFVRDNGWSLGAPMYLLAEAEACWPQSWIAIIDMRTGNISHYQSSAQE